MNGMYKFQPVSSRPGMQAQRPPHPGLPLSPADCDLKSSDCSDCPAYLRQILRGMWLGVCCGRIRKQAPGGEVSKAKSTYSARTHMGHPHTWALGFEHIGTYTAFIYTHRNSTGGHTLWCRHKHHSLHRNLYVVGVIAHTETCPHIPDVYTLWTPTHTFCSGVYLKHSRLYTHT
jgi:hypothetical protein